MKALLSAVALAATFVSSSVFAASGDVVLEEKSEQADYRLTVVTEELEFPWGLAFLPDGGMLVTEKPGRLRVIRGGRLDPTPVRGVPQVLFLTDGGLLDVTLHPRFADNQYVYLCFAHGTEERNVTRVVRGRFVGTALSGVVPIFTGNNVSKNGGRSGSHFGCRMAWKPDGTLFITLGDRYDFKERAQNPRNHYGKVVRIADDGAIPRDNPFADGVKGMPEVWSYGHRNMQGAAVHPATRTLWIHEHGPKGGDEINIPLAGRNYGWPIATYGIDYDDTIISEYTERPGTEQPVFYWRPSIAPSGMAFYTGSRFPKWRGDLFVGALAGKHLERLELEGQRVQHNEILLDGLKERIRDVRDGPDGYLYILTDNQQGRLLRLEPRPAE